MNFRTRLSQLIAARVVVGTLLLGLAILVQLRRPGAVPSAPLFFLIALTYGLSVVYLATLAVTVRRRWLVDIQLALDALLVTGFISVTGGITSFFSSLYLLPIIAASTIRFRRGALQVFGMSAALYLALVTAQYAGVLPSAWQATAATVLPDAVVAQYTVTINLLLFLLAAIVAGSLAEGLRSAGAELEVASSKIEGLRVFNEYVIDSLLSGLATADTDGRVLTFNRAAALITGVASRDAVGAGAADLLQLPVPFRERLGSLPQTRSLRVDLEYRTANRGTIELGVAASTLAFPDGRAGYLFTFQDVTDLKRLEREGRLQQRLAAVGEMAAGIAHEIRNPLASMSGSIQVLRQELPLTGEQAQLMDIVLRESERLNDTIRSFLAYARPQRFAVARLDLARMVQDTALLLRNSAEVRDGHSVEVDVPPAPLWYDADENQIRQILWNLATNGLRSMTGGGRLLLSAVVAPAGEAAGQVELAVQDQGCGIPPDQLDGIFQPYRSSFEKGTGLGLAIVHRIVTDYGGGIQVASAVGIGTTVRVRLPIRPTAVAAAAASATGAPDAAAAAGER